MERMGLRRVADQGRHFEAKIGGEYRLCIPSPGNPGLFMHVHQSIRVSCPKCGAHPFDPCKTKTGSLAITGKMIETVSELAHHQRVRQSDLEKLRARLRQFEPVRAEPHPERKKRYQASPSAKPIRGPRGRIPSLSAEAARELRRVADYVLKHGNGDG